MKRILAMVLSMCMLFSVFAMNAVAAGESNMPAQENSVQPTEETVAPAQLQEEAVTDAAPELLEAEPDVSHPHTADIHSEYAGKTWTAWDGKAATIIDANNYGVSGYYYLTGNCTMEKWIGRIFG